MTVSLHCRLLCASVCAYNVQPDGTVGHDAPYFAAVGFADEPRATSADINACLVGRIAEGLVIAFRGTLPFNTGGDPQQIIRDWINDLHAELVHGGSLPGLVHEGFWGSLDSLWPFVRSQIDVLAGAVPPPAVYITGHSKGGAVADLAAMRLKLEKGITAKVVTFAGAHPGNTDFADAYGLQIDDSIRYEFAEDIVPHLPPSLRFRAMFQAVPFMQPYVHRLDLDYTAVGTLQYIERDGSVVGDSPTLPFERFGRLAQLIAAGQFARIVDDHSSRCGGGYMKGVCPPDLCAGTAAPDLVP
jgi:hypothetical protein